MSLLADFFVLLPLLCRLLLRLLLCVHACLRGHPGNIDEILQFLFKAATMHVPVYIYGVQQSEPINSIVLVPYS